MLFSFLLGLVTGFRSLVVPAVVAWAAHLGWLDLQGSSLAFMGGTPALVVLTTLGVFELIADKLPRTPNRTSPLGLIARLVMGALVGASWAASSHQPLPLGAALGSVGGLVGAFMGFTIRTGLVKVLKVPDLFIALLEDLVTIAIAIFVVLGLP